MKELKRASTLWLRKQSRETSAFSWQNGYGIFSVSFSNLDRVRTYIATQEAHHRKMTFQEELRLLLLRHQFGVGGRLCLGLIGPHYTEVDLGEAVLPHLTH